MKYTLIKSMTSDGFSWGDFNLEEFNREFRHLTDSIMRLKKKSYFWKVFRLCCEFFEHFSEERDSPLTLQEHELNLYFEKNVSFVSLSYASLNMCDSVLGGDYKWIEFKKCLYKLQNRININFRKLHKQKSDRYEMFNLKTIDRKTIFFQTNDVQNASKVIRFQIKDFNFGFCNSQICDRDKEFRLLRDKKNRFSTRSVEWFTVKCLISGGDIGSLQASPGKLKALYYDYRYGWVGANVNQLDGASGCVSFNNRIKNIEEKGKPTSVEVSFPKLSNAISKKIVELKILVSMIDPSFDLPNYEVHLPQTILIKSTSPALTINMAIKNSHRNSINAHSIYETISKMSMDDNSLYIDDWRFVFTPGRIMIKFLNEILRSRSFADTINELSSHPVRNNEDSNLWNFEYLCYMIFCLRESLFLEQKKIILDSMIKINSDMCDGKFSNLDSTKFEMHFEALRHLFRRMLPGALARSLFSHIIKKFIFESSKNKKDLDLLDLEFSFLIDNFTDISVLRSFGSSKTYLEPTAALRFFMYYRPLKPEQVICHLGSLLRSDLIKCQTNLNLITRLIGKISRRFFHRTEKKYSRYYKWAYSHLKDELENFLKTRREFKLLLLIIEKNFEYFTNRVLNGMRFLDFDFSMYVYVSLATDQRYTHHVFYDKLSPIFSSPNAIKNFLVTVIEKYDELKKFFEEDYGNFEYYLYPYERATINSLLKYIASSFKVGPMFDLEDFRNICKIVLFDRLYDASLITALFSMVKREDSRSALLHLTETLWQAVVGGDDDSMWLKTEKFEDIFKELNVHVWNFKDVIDKSYYMRFSESFRRYKFLDSDFYLELKKILMDTSIGEDIKANYFNVFQNNVKAVLIYKLRGLKFCSSSFLSPLKALHQCLS
jgi:hypothetical protein